MKNLIKAEFYKFKRNFYFWIILLIMILCYLPSLLGNNVDTFQLLLKNVEKDIMVIPIALAIYSGLTITNDFSNRTIMHYISAGHKRSHIILVEFLSFFLTSMLIIALYLTIILLLSSLILSFPLLSNFTVLLYSIIKLIVLYSGLTSIFFLIGILIKKGTASMGASITFSILAVVLSNKFYNGIDSLWRFNPLIQLQINNNFSLDLIIAGIISLIILTISLIISILHFRNDEFK